MRVKLSAGSIQGKKSFFNIMITSGPFYESSFLLREKLIGLSLVQKILRWRHSGFNVHSRVRATTKREAESVGKYMIGKHFSWLGEVGKNALKIRKINSCRKASLWVSSESHLLWETPLISTRLPPRQLTLTSSRPDPLPTITFPVLRFRNRIYSAPSRTSSGYDRNSNRL
jgi:hypothetical protein